MINDHSGPVAATLGAAIDTPVVHTVHGPLDGEPGELYDQVSRVAPRDGVHLALDEPAQAAAGLQLARELSERARPLRLSVPSAPRRLPALPRAHEPGQGRASRRRRGDGGRAAAEDRRQDARAEGARSTSREFVEPHLGNGIEWLGEVSHGEKVELLQHARATLFPIEWEEPFGLVMIESMACGTPVIATARGAVPEVIEHGRSGIIVEDYRIIPEALEEADRLDSRELRRYVEERFSPMRMVRDYGKAYELAVERAHA